MNKPTKTTKVLGVPLRAEPKVVDEYERATRELSEALDRLWHVLGIYRALNWINNRLK